MDKPDSHLPRLGKALLWLSLDDEEYDQAVGDREERLRRQAAAEGRARALAGFWIMLLRSLPRFIGDSLYWRIVMIVNNLKLAWRAIRRQKLYSAFGIITLRILKESPRSFMSFLKGFVL